MKISKEDLARIEKLAALRIPPEREDAIKESLMQVFDWIEQLKSVDVTNTAPLTNPVIEIINEAPLREDVAHLDNSKDHILENAPDQNYGFFLVPKVVE